MRESGVGMDYGGYDTVELRSKGPGRKGNPLIREMILGSISYFLFYLYSGYYSLTP